MSHALLYQWRWKFYPVFSWLSSLGIAQSIILAKKKITIFPLTKSRIMPCHAIFPSSKNYQYFCILLRFRIFFWQNSHLDCPKKELCILICFKNIANFFKGFQAQFWYSYLAIHSLRWLAKNYFIIRRRKMVVGKIHFSWFLCNSSTWHVLISYVNILNS